MSRHDYPRIGSTRALGNDKKRKVWKTNPKAAPRCVVIGCTCPATARVDVEVNWFRGDDEVGQACATHKSDAAAVLAGIEARRSEQAAKREAAEAAKAQGGAA